MFSSSTIVEVEDTIGSPLVPVRFFAGKPCKQKQLLSLVRPMTWTERETKMKRDEKGRYMRKENIDKNCKVLLENGEKKEMTKGKMYELIKDDKEKKIVFQNGLYHVVHKDIYQAIKQPEWNEAKQKNRNHMAFEKMETKSKEKKQIRTIVEIPVGDYYECLQYGAVEGDSPEELLCKKERLAELYDALDTLSKRDREIMKLFSNQYVDAAIGEEIGMSQRGVNKRKKAILVKLREILEKIR